MSVFKMTLEGTTWLPEDDPRIETCWSDFKCFNVKFYVSALVGVLIKIRNCSFARTWIFGAFPKQNLKKKKCLLAPACVPVRPSVRM